jgi:hypothetical protein
MMKTLLGALIAVTTAAQAASRSWPQWRGPARDAVIASFTAPAAWPAQLTRRWQSDRRRRTRLARSRWQPRHRAHAAIDLASGKTLWLTTGREAENASIVRAGEFLLLATTNSELIAAKASAAAFEEVTRYTVADSAMWAHPASRPAASSSRTSTS